MPIGVLGVNADWEPIEETPRLALADAPDVELIADMIDKTRAYADALAFRFAQGRITPFIKVVKA
jgi:hypothetical protein